MPVNTNAFHVYKTESIKSFLEGKSETMYNYMEVNPDSEYMLFYKYITHSDLTNRGKRNGSKEGLDKNFLYYLSVEEMKKIEDEQGSSFESAKQSNIGLSQEFFDYTGIPRLIRRTGHQSSQHKHILLNDYCKVFLVNDTVRYFNMNYTIKIFEKLNKDLPRWANDNENIVLNINESFTPIQLTEAIHGVGTEDDKDFHKLRLSIFKNDIFMLIFERKPDGSNCLFILFEKNPRFFTLIGATNVLWENYLIKKQNKDETQLKLTEEIITLEKTRAHQSKWKDRLAEEMMNFTTKDGEVFCPLTYIRANIKQLSSLFVASHIKRFEACSLEEAWDLNNGLLLCANADALFDKHYITISEDRQLKFSFLIETDYELKAKLQLMNPVFTLILSDERMKYIEEHRKIFEEKELKRKTSAIT